MIRKRNLDGTTTEWDDKGNYAGKVAAPGPGIAPGATVPGHTSALAGDPIPDESFSTAWDRFQRERTEQGMPRSELIPRTVNDKYTIEHKKDTRAGVTYYAAYVKDTGETKSFPSYGRAETWAQACAGVPLESSDQYAFRSHLLLALDAEVHSDARPGAEVPLLVHTEPMRENEPPHTFRVYRYADTASPTRESWHVDFDYPDPLVRDRFLDAGRLWEGDQAPTRQDLLDAVEAYHDPSE